MAINFPSFFNCMAKITSAFRMLTGLCGTGAASPASSWGSQSGGMSGGHIRCMNELINNIQGRVGQSYPELMSGTAYSVNAPLYQLQTTLPSGVSAALTYLQSLAQGLVLDVVNTDTLQPGLTLPVAMGELVRQMVSQSETVHWNTCSSTVTAGGGNVGNPTIVVAFKDANGNLAQYAYNETLVLTTTSDVGDGATAGNETISIAAPAGQVAPSLTYLWPSGNGYCSGYTGTVTVVDPTQSNGAGGNLLSNSSFKGTWTSNLPQYWLADVGVAGTNWQNGTSNNYLGSANCFQFIGDGSTLASVTQPFANGSVATGNTTTLNPETVYLFRAMYKLSVGNPGAGVLAFSLVDGSGVVINDNAGNPNTISISLPSVASTSYQALSGSFRLPSNPPANVTLRMKLTTALSNGVNLFIDGIGMSQPAQQTSPTIGGIYAGGPYISVFRGSTDTIDYIPNPAYGDRWTVAINNDYNGLFQTFFWQVMNMPSLGLVLPNASVPTEADSLIQ